MKGGKLMFKKIKHERDKVISYIYDPTRDIKDRSFILFSIVVLISLFIAVPCGLVMHEPPIATVSTFAGALFFSVYVKYSVKNNKIEKAKKVISVLLIFIFLPAMFFTNGGSDGGAPVWLLLGTIYISLILKGRQMHIMMVLNVTVTVLCWVIGYCFPETVTTYSRGGNYFDSIAALFIVGAIVFTLFTFQTSLLRQDEQQKNLSRLFDQTATALVNAIDAKDKYTHGHSSRVAEYSRKLAELSGKSKKECDEIYYAALLHDVGKIGIPENIITKEGKLSDSEYATIKKHPEMGAQILHSISEYPFLSIGAKYHHERYDGRGYPEGLKGNDIPEAARIIAAADTYDAMTSKRSYRDPIPQQQVREEFIKCSGTQFDPQFAKLMIHLIDIDTEYEMKENEDAQDLSGKSELICTSHRSAVSEGFIMNPFAVHIHVRVTGSRPSILLFDSLDERYHSNEWEQEKLCYFEYAEIFFNGKTELKGARKIESEKTEVPDEHSSESKKALQYSIKATKIKDHALVEITGGGKKHRYTIALPDSARFLYLALTGEDCQISNVRIHRESTPAAPDAIPRIAEEISYINVPAGDIPNLQVDGYRTAASEGILIKDGMEISFHTMSLPTARLIWHCPYVALFCSDDKKVNGKNYKEFTLIRMDGEDWESNDISENRNYVNTTDEYDGWDTWKKANKEGIDCKVTFRRSGSQVTVITENAGIRVRNITEIKDGTKDIYAALTGDQCALTNIRIKYI